MADKPRSPIALDGPARERAERIGGLRALAGELAIRGEHDKAADAHFQRAQMHEQEEDYQSAMDAYKAACDCYGKAAKGGAQA